MMIRMCITNSMMTQTRWQWVWDCGVVLCDGWVGGRWSSMVACNCKASDGSDRCRRRVRSHHHHHFDFIQNPHDIFYTDEGKKMMNRNDKKMDKKKSTLHLIWQLEQKQKYLKKKCGYEKDQQANWFIQFECAMHVYETIWNFYLHFTWRAVFPRRLLRDFFVEIYELVSVFSSFISRFLYICLKLMLMHMHTHTKHSFRQPSTRSVSDRPLHAITGESHVKKMQLTRKKGTQLRFAYRLFHIGHSGRKTFLSYFACNRLRCSYHFYIDPRQWVGCCNLADGFEKNWANHEICIHIRLIPIIE